MSARERLPDRRFTVSIDFVHDGQRYVGGIGYFPDGRVGEVWLRAHKPDSQVDGLAGGAAILNSILLQHDVGLAEIRHSLIKSARAGDPLGRLLALIEQPAFAQFLTSCEAPAQLTESRDKHRCAVCGRAWADGSDEPCRKGDCPMKKSRNP